MKHFDAVVGVSVNPELGLVVEDTPGPKKILRDVSCCLSGSSGNTATAIKKLGSHPHLLGLVGVNSQEEIAGKLLHDVINGSGMSFFTPIPVLDHTNFAAIPVAGESNGEVWGKKGEIVHTAMTHALHSLARPEIGVGPQTFVVVTSLRAPEVPFAKALLSQAQPGFRVLNAKDTLCASKEFRKILPLVDLLVLNRHEFDETKMALACLHDLGPKVIIVTYGEYGGMFSCNTSSLCLSLNYNPVKFSGGKFETGAGDWFLGALISELIRLKESVFSIKPEQFKEVVDFAAKVAGKKITIPGGGNGPSRHQLES